MLRVEDRGTADTARVAACGKPYGLYGTEIATRSGGCAFLRSGGDMADRLTAMRTAAECINVACDHSRLGLCRVYCILVNCSKVASRESETLYRCQLARSMLAFIVSHQPLRRVWRQSENSLIGNLYSGTVQWYSGMKMSGGRKMESME